MCPATCHHTPVGGTWHAITGPMPVSHSKPKVVLGTDIDLSSYNAFRFTVVSAPQNAGHLQVRYTWVAPGSGYALATDVALAASGIVYVPFSSFLEPWSRANMGGGYMPPIDWTHAQAVGLEFRGNLLTPGMYVLDDFQAVAIPAPGAVCRHHRPLGCWPDSQTRTLKPRVEITAHPLDRRPPCVTEILGTAAL